MKIAFLFSGQLRKIPYEIFRKSLSILTEDLDYSIFSYCWEEQGKSLNHKNNLPDLYYCSNIETHLKFIFKDFNLIDYGYESFTSFKNNLPNEYRKIMNSKEFHFGTINSLPQIYTLYKSFQLLDKSNSEFDLIFKCRYDSVFIHQMKFLPLLEINNTNCLYSLNFGRSYYPNRVYDIFFGGSRKSMKFISSIWDDIPMLLNNRFSNGLDKRDCCRLIYLAAKLDNIKVDSFKSRICDVYRNNNLLYAKYLISSHLISINLNQNKLEIIISMIKSFRYMGIKKFKILAYFIKSIIFLPFSFLKRVKYLKFL